MNTRNLGLSALLIGAIVGVSGCMMDWGTWSDSGSSDPSYGSYDGYYSTPSNLEIRSGYLSGTMGDVTFANDAWRIEGSNFGGYTQIELEASAATGAAMTILNIQGGLDNPVFVPGAALSFDSSSYSSTVEVTVVGCSGPSSGSWVYDHSSEQVDVRVDVGPAPNMRHFSYVATFDDGTGRQQTTGSFDYVAN